MFRLLASLVALLSAALLPSPARANTQVVRVINWGGVSQKVLRRDLSVWQQATNRAFAPVWGVPPVRLVTHGRGNITVVIWSGEAWDGEPGAVHTVAYGHPRINIYMRALHQDRENLSAVFTHELFEALVDPSQNKIVVRPNGDAWYVEVCDPAGKPWVYRGLQISDFVTPQWFGLSSGDLYDWDQKITQPFSIAPGGSQIVWDGHSFLTVWG